MLISTFLLPFFLARLDSFEDVVVQASQQVRNTHLFTAMASSTAPGTSAADELLSIAYRDLETANKKLEEANINLFRLKLVKVQCFSWPEGDYDELARERDECVCVLFGKPARWTAVEREVSDSEWWAEANDYSAGVLAERIRGAEFDVLEREVAQASIRRRIAAMAHDQVRHLSVLDLPDEILVDIFRYVESAQLPWGGHHAWGDGKDIVNARQVCRRFCRAASEFLVRRICVEPNNASLARLDEVSRHPAIAAGVWHVQLVLRLYNPSFASMRDFAIYHAHVLDAQIETWLASQTDHEDAAGQAAPAVENAAYFGYTLRRLVAAPASPVDTLPDIDTLPDDLRRLAGIAPASQFDLLPDDILPNDKTAMEWLGQAHREYLRLVEEQELLLGEGRFAQILGSAVARMPRARHLEIVDMDRPEPELLGSDVGLWAAMDEYMRRPMGGEGAVSCNHLGIQPPSYQCVVDVLNGVRGGGAWLETVATSLHSLGLVGSMAPTLDSHRELASGLQKLTRFECKIWAEMGPESVDDVEKFVRACIDTPSLEYISIDLKHHSESEPSVDMGNVMGATNRKLLSSLWLCRVDFHLDDLKVFLNHLTHERVSLSMADLYLLSGTWKELLDILRDKAGKKWLRRPSGQELEDMSPEDYYSIFRGEDGGGIAQLYISKELSGWSAPNPIQALEDRQAAAAATAAATAAAAAAAAAATAAAAAVTAPPS